jgi:ketosteroid isomerase-like protein
MAGLDPAIHVFLAYCSKDVDARYKAGHDDYSWEISAQTRLAAGGFRGYSLKDTLPSSSG